MNSPYPPLQTLAFPYFLVDLVKLKKGGAKTKGGKHKIDEGREYVTSVEQRIKIMELAVEAIKGTAGDKTLLPPALANEITVVYTTMYNLINPQTNQSNE